MANSLEIAALMRRTAAAGFASEDRKLAPNECLEVCEFIIRESSRYSRPLDMRLLLAGFHDYLQADAHEAGLSWRDLISSTLANQWYTTDEVAAIVGKATFTVREWCRLGRVHAENRDRGRGNAQEWIISHQELTRFRNEGLLPTPGYRHVR